MKTLKLSATVTLLSLFCMGMGFPNLALDEEVESSKSKSTRRNKVQSVAMACTRQVKVTQQSEKEAQQPCLTAKTCCKKAV